MRAMKPKPAPLICEPRAAALAVCMTGPVVVAPATVLALTGVGVKTAVVARVLGTATGGTATALVGETAEGVGAMTNTEVAGGGTTGMELFAGAGTRENEDDARTGGPDAELTGGSTVEIGGAKYAVDEVAAVVEAGALEISLIEQGDEGATGFWI